MTSPPDGVERRLSGRRSTDRELGELHRAVIAAAAVVLVIAAAVAGSVVADRINSGPTTREGVTQSVDNGRRLCDIASSLSQVVLVFTPGDVAELTDEQREALNDLRGVADDCAAHPPGDGS